MPVKVQIKECNHCGDEIKDDEYREKDEYVYCDRCYHEQHEFTCPICEEYHDNQTRPQETFFYLHVNNGDLKPGYYSVLNYPVWTSDMINVYINDYNVKLESSNVCYKNDGPLEETNYICKECFEKKGLDDWNIYKHIEQSFNAEYKRLGEPKLWSRINVKVSKEYFNAVSGKSKWPNKVFIEMDETMKTQEVSVTIV